MKPMRILLVGSHKEWRMERGLERAFRRMGHHTRLIDDKRARRTLGHALTQRWARWHLARYRPDFVFLSKCRALDHETVAALVKDRPNALWYLDPPYYRYPERPDIAHLIGVGALARTFFVSGFEAEWRALGVNAKFLPAAGDRDIVPEPPSPRYACDLTFIGTGYDPERAEFLAALAREFRVRVWGKGWKKWRETLNWGGRAVEGRDFARACSSAGAVLGINPRIADGATTYASNRMWISILAGGFYLGAGTPGMESLLRDGEHCAWYRDVDSCVAQARRYLGDPALRERVRARGERFVREHHTFDQRARNILNDEEWVNPLR
jgi:hypothetical protein